MKGLTKMSVIQTANILRQRELDSYRAPGSNSARHQEVLSANRTVVPSTAPISPQNNAQPAALKKSFICSPSNKMAKKRMIVKKKPNSVSSVPTTNNRTAKTNSIDVNKTANLKMANTTESPMH